jgi:hypothetical protein
VIFRRRSPPADIGRGYGVSQRQNAPAQFVYDFVEMTDCIFEAINSNMQVSIRALTGRKCSSILA